MQKIFTIIKFFLAIILSPVILNCQQVAQPTFEELKSLRKNYPDSVIHILSKNEIEVLTDINSDDWSMLLGQAYYYSDEHMKAYQIFDSLRHSFNPLHYHKQQLYQSLASTTLFLGKFDLSEEFSLTSLRLAEERNDSSAVYNALISVGNAQYYNGSTHLAIKKYLGALAIVPDSTKAGNVYVNLGGLMIESGQLEKGIKYTKKGFLSLGDNPAERDKKVVLNNLATAYYKLEHIDSSRMYLEQYAAYENNSTYNQFFIDLLYGNIYIKQKLYIKAEQHLSSALSSSQELQDRHSEALVYGSFAWLYNLIGEKNKSNKSFDLSKSILDSLGSTNDLIELEEQRLTSNLSSTNLEHFKTYQSLLKGNNFGEINQIIASYLKEVELVAKQDSLEDAMINQRLKISENSRYRYGLFLSLAIIGLLASLLYIFSNRSKKLKSKNQQLQEEKQVLIFQKKELEAINTTIKNNQTKSKPNPTEIFIDVVINNKQIKLNTESINYVCAEDNGCRFYLDDKSEWSYIRLKEVKEQLPIHQFAQIHRSYIVKVDAISSINHSSLDMSDGRTLNIGRSYKGKVLSLFE